MKRIIAISIVLTLLATAAFAIEVKVEGQVAGKAVLAEGDFDSDKVGASASMQRIRIQAEGKNEAETFGAWARLDYTGTGVNADLSILDDLADFDPEDVDFFSKINFSGYAWWQPIEAFKLIIGSNGGDCFFYKDGVTGFDFHADAGVVGVAIENWAFFGKRAWGEQGPFFGGFGENALMMEIKPISALGVNIVIPFAGVGAIESYYAGIIAQFDVDLGAAGNFALTYEGDSSHDTLGKLYVYYNFAQEDGISIDLGIAYEMENKDKDAVEPFSVGLGFAGAFTDTFELRARAMGTFGGDPIITFDVLPVIGINEHITAFIGLGCVVVLTDEVDFNWTFNPYISVGGSFFAGLQVYSVGETIKWAVPIGVNFSF